MTDSSRPLILLGLNEVHFDLVRKYAARGLLPNFQKLFDTTSEIITSSEVQDHELEPWIQWTSVHTGQSFKEHKIFRLGDGAHATTPQIWEHLEAQYGLRVAAISPMNADNRCQNPAFFMPDPWTGTQPSGSLFVRLLSRAVSDVVHKNATGGSKLSSLFLIGIALLRYSMPQQGLSILHHISKSLRSSYQRSILLDQLLTDIFVSHWLDSRPDFSSLFLNGCAHLQHHYFFNAAPYEGACQNPDWYMPQNRDPVLNGFRGYDKILGRMMNLPNAPRLLIATGLRQKPVETPVYYWRLKNHARFLNKVGIAHHSVQPLMSRDFIVHFENEDQAAQAQKKFVQITDETGEAIFGDIDNRGTSLFVSLTYPHDIRENFILKYGSEILRDFHSMVGFVAFKNGEHDGQGYLFDTANDISSDTALPVWEIFKVIEAHFDKNKTAQSLDSKEAA